MDCQSFVSMVGLSCALGGISVIAGDREEFAQVESAPWTEVWTDDGTGDWRGQWFLDGLTAKVTNNEDGMHFSAGPTEGNHADHAVLWTRESFAGDIRIDYEYTRTDSAIRNVNILYVQATGSAEGPFAKDIRTWSDLREEPWMKHYYNNMNAYHISYAAFGTKNEDPEKDYIRARRYLPLAGQKMKGTNLEPDYERTGLFETGIPHRITVIKKGRDLFMRIRNAEQEMICHWPNPDLPDIVAGRIGLRHMYARSARYRNMRISVLMPDP